MLLLKDYFYNYFIQFDIVIKLRKNIDFNVTKQIVNNDNLKFVNITNIIVLKILKEVLY